jgi:very-short-patch-repair endonuclease
MHATTLKDLVRNRRSALKEGALIAISALRPGNFVIELDDRSHRRADRQDADARKTKALEYAGLRLVRIPAGAQPSGKGRRGGGHRTRGG